MKMRRRALLGLCFNLAHPLRLTPIFSPGFPEGEDGRTVEPEAMPDDHPLLLRQEIQGIGDQRGPFPLEQVVLGTLDVRIDQKIS